MAICPVEELAVSEWCFWFLPVLHDLMHSWDLIKVAAVFDRLVYTGRYRRSVVVPEHEKESYIANMRKLTVSACFIMLTYAVVTACGEADTGSTPVPVSIDIPTQTASKIQSEPTVTSILFQLLRLLR